MGDTTSEAGKGLEVEAELEGEPLLPAQWIAGIGASAGGLDALVRLFGGASVSTAVALVVIQHLSPDHKSLMPELLARRTTMPVELAQNGAVPCAGTIYVMPPQQDLTFEDGRFRLWPRREGVVHHPIDVFFASLATALGTRAIGVVLSGTGRDGTQGALAIHAAGGLVFVQDPSTAGFEGMPTSAIEAGIADGVLPPEKILETVCRSAEVGAEPTGAELDASALRTVIALLSRRQHIDFTVYKTGSLRRRAERRSQELGFGDLSAYAAHLVDHPEELERLGREVLIGVSSFFRDAETFELLESSELPRLIRSSDFDGTLRAWSVGCSTGQEPYSVAMLLVEAAEALGLPAQIKVFATDVDPVAIERAGAGVFSASIQDELQGARLSRFFRHTHEGYRVERGLRQCVVFSVHNALKDPPYSRLDLVTCRNLLIYLQPSAQRDLLTRLAVALKPGGILVLGSSETLGEVADAFDVVDARTKTYRRRPGRLRADFYGTGLMPSSAYRRGAPAEIPEQRRVLDEAYRTLARLDSPVSLVVNALGHVIHTTGDVKEFFSIPVGAATLDIVQLARGTLSTLLATGLSAVRRDGKTVEYHDVEARLGEQAARLSLRIVPLADSGAAPHHLVSLRRSEPRATSSVDSLPVRFDTAALEAMQVELSSTRENLHSAIEELETTNEELQATNEEMLAANEELQATNEELQATNEELATTNAESERRIQDLIELNADMDGLLRSTDIGTLFLDEHLAVRKFTPLVAAFVSLMDRDVGRPIEHVRHSLGEVDLVGLARGVLDDDSPAETSARSGERHLLLKAVPYQLRGRVRGVVISFVDVSELVAARDRLEGVLESLPEQVAVLDKNGTILSVNRSWLEFGLANGAKGAPADVVGTNYVAIAEVGGRTEADALSVAEGLRGVLSGALAQFSTEYRCDAPWEDRHFFMQVRSLGSGRGAVVSHIEVTRLARTTMELQETAALYQRLFTMTGEPLLLLDPASATILDANPASSELLGSQREQLVSMPVFRVLRPEGRTWESLLATALAQGSIEGVEVTAGRASTEQQVHVSLHVVESHGARVVLLRAREPLTERLLGERAALRTRLTQSQKMEALGLLAGGVAHELNNVLTAILSVVYAGRQDVAPDSALAGDLDAVISACRRGADLTRNLLGFARSGSIARERFELSEVAGEVVGLVERTLPANVRTQLRTPDRSPIVLGDRSQVAQALMNLCVNAIDAVRGSGRITVEVGTERFPRGEADGKLHAFLRVSDDGVGMDEATRNHAFDPFFTTKPRGEGTGLGLSMVYGVARSHGGWTDLESHAGAGTTVTVALPLGPETVDKSPVVPAVPGTGERILVVDDDDLVRRSLQRMLERQGYVAESAEGGALALDRVRAPNLPPIQFVLLDVSMPELDGIETHARLRKTHPALPVLFYSGYADQAPDRKLELDGKTGFCSKPIDPDRLAHMIRMTLRGERLPSFAPAAR